MRSSGDDVVDSFISQLVQNSSLVRVEGSTGFATSFSITGNVRASRLDALTVVGVSGSLTLNLVPATCKIVESGSLVAAYRKLLEARFPDGGVITLTELTRSGL
jgi:hypothetical protein